MGQNAGFAAGHLLSDNLQNFQGSGIALKSDSLLTSTCGMSMAASRHCLAPAGLSARQQLCSRKP